MNIRPFQLSDYVYVRDIFRTVLSVECYRLTLDAFARQIAWDSDLVLVAHVGNEVLGVIIGTIDRNHGIYYRVAVRKEHQRQGIGSSLIKALRSRFERRNVVKILIAADEHNEPIMKVYEAQGFEAKHMFKKFNKLSILTGAYS